MYKELIMEEPTHPGKYILALVIFILFIHSGFDQVTALIAVYLIWTYLLKE